PRNRISPVVTGSTPETRLNTVLLPAPLGPMRPWIAPSVTTMERSATAARPPKRRDTPLSSSSNPDSHLARAGSAAALHRASQPTGNRHKPVGHEQHGQDEDQAVDQRLVGAQLPQRLRGERQQDGPQDRSPHAAHTADD